MGIHLSIRKTAITRIAMKKVFPSTNSTNTTSVTMKNFFCKIVVIKKITNSTKVSCKFNTTRFAILLWSLFGKTFIAFYSFYIMAINLVIFFRIKFILIFYFVMTKSAREKFQASGTLFLTSPFIMFTTKFCIYFFDFFFFFYFKFSFFFKTWFNH